MRAAFDFTRIDLPLEVVLREAERCGGVAVPCHPGRPHVGLCAHYEAQGPRRGRRVGRDAERRQPRRGRRGRARARGGARLPRHRRQRLAHREPDRALRDASSRRHPRRRRSGHGAARRRLRGTVMEIDVEALKARLDRLHLRHRRVRGRDRRTWSTSRWPAARPTRATPIPSHPDFQAVPNYPSRYVGRRVLPDDFPRLGGGYGFDAGKCVTPLAPIRAGDKLTAQQPDRRHLHQDRSLGDDALHRAPHEVLEPARRAGVDRRLAHGPAGSERDDEPGLRRRGPRRRAAADRART